MKSDIAYKKLVIGVSCSGTESFSCFNGFLVFMLAFSRVLKGMHNWFELLGCLYINAERERERRESLCYGDGNKADHRPLGLK